MRPLALFFLFILFGTSFGYGVAVGVWKIFPYSLLADVYKTAFYEVALYSGLGSVDLSDDSLGSPGHSSLNSELAEGFGRFGYQIDLPAKLVGSETIVLNNFGLKWGRVINDQFRVIGGSEFREASVVILNQDDSEFLNAIGMADNVGSTGGVKSVITIGKKRYAYVSFVENDCGTAAFFDIDTQTEVFRFKCAAGGVERIDLAGVGGGWYPLSEDSILFATGTPSSSSHADAEVNLDAQDPSSPWGKVLEIQVVEGEFNVSVFSKGHRNMQGVASVQGFMWGVEHGPRGGDELNVLTRGGNYGWPRHSFGSEYDLTKINKNNLVNEGFLSPFYSFVPSIGVSSVGECPVSYADYYSPNFCVAVSSLRGNSIFLIVHDGMKVFFNEVLPLKSRIRRFKFYGDKLVAITDNEGMIIGIISRLQ